MESNRRYASVLAMVVMTSIILASVQSAPVEARTESYDGPCNEGDWEKNGGCCPPDAEYMVHNDCMSEGDYQQHQDANSEMGKCVIGRTIEGVITGDAVKAASALGC